VWGGSKLCSQAAHHLIPGNASLKPSQLMQSGEYLKVDGAAEGNIGYNVNCEQNGIWLPGNYAVRPWSAKGESTKREYAFAAIEAYGRQFHDAHEVYSNFVLECLDDIYLKLKMGKNLWCEESSKKDKKKGNLYMLVARLHTVSTRMATLLRFPCKGKWKSNVYTSRFDLEYMRSNPEY
jgi:hypothetical protein